jgi:hypothetical protein
MLLQFTTHSVVGRADMNKLTGKANHQNYDAHVVPIVPANPSNVSEVNHYPAEACAAGACTYVEVVAFEQQALPRSFVELRPRSLPRPISVPSQYSQFFNGSAAVVPDLRRLISDLSSVAALKASIQQGEEHRKQRIQLIRSSKIDATIEARHLMKDSSEVEIGKIIGEGSSSTVHNANARYMCTSVA